MASIRRPLPPQEALTATPRLRPDRLQQLAHARLTERPGDPAPVLRNGVDAKELQPQFWQIGQWRELRPPLSGCLFLDDGTWSPHNCDSYSPPHNLRA